MHKEKFMNDKKFHYSAKVTKVYDGDTITCDIDLGFGIVLKNQKFRFYGINAPELYGNSEVSGKACQTYVSDKILDKEIIIETILDKKEKYGRWLGKISYLVDDEWINLNEELVENKLAIVFMADKEEV